MTAQASGQARATCRCGQVQIALSGAPFLTAICCCASCQAAGREFERACGAPPVVRPDGGTEYALYRKDRVRVAAGGERLQARRLTAQSPTRRMVASCCATPMFLEVAKGHWISLYRDRLPDAPPPEMRVMAKAAAAGARFDDAVPTYPGFPGRFVVRLLGARLRMGWRPPAFRW